MQTRCKRTRRKESHQPDTPSRPSSLERDRRHKTSLDDRDRTAVTDEEANKELR